MAYAWLTASNDKLATFSENKLFFFLKKKFMFGTLYSYDETSVVLEAKMELVDEMIVSLHPVSPLAETVKARTKRANFILGRLL